MNWVSIAVPSTIGIGGILKTAMTDLQPSLQTLRFWNRIPNFVKEQVVNIALEEPDKSPRELACHITDKYEYFISESSVYRILKSYDLITSPAFILMSAGDKFKNPTKRVNELLTSLTSES